MCTCVVDIDDLAKKEPNHVYLRFDIDPTL